jgi:hypothetical protein
MELSGSKALVITVGLFLTFYALLIFGSSFYSYGQQPVSYDQYNNETYGIEIQYPSDWKVDTKNYNENSTRYTTLVAFFSPLNNYKDPFQDFVEIIHDKVPYKANLAGYLDEAINSYKDLKNFHLVSSTTGFSLGGLPAYKLTYTYRDDSVSPPLDEKVNVVGTLVGNDAFFIRYYAQKNSYPNYLPIFNKMIESFKTTTGGLNTQEASGPSNPQEIQNTQENPLPTEQGNLKEFQGVSSPAGQGLMSYENQFFGIQKLTYPEGWSVYENETSIQLTSPSKGISPATVRITTYLSENRTLEDFAADDYNYYSSNPNLYAILESKHIKLLGDQPAHLEVVGFVDNQSRVFKDLTILSVKNRLLYVIDYVALDEKYQRYLPVVINLIKSLDLGTSSEVQNNQNISEPPAILSPL